MHAAMMQIDAQSAQASGVVIFLSLLVGITIGFAVCRLLLGPARTDHKYNALLEWIAEAKTLRVEYDDDTRMVCIIREEMREP